MWNITLLGLSLLGLWLGAEWIVRGAAAIAARLGMSTIVIGLTIIAFGTDLPELVVALRGAWLSASR